MYAKIYVIKTGDVKIKKAQQVRKPGGLIRVIFDDKWTDWLPVYAWVIEHPEGVFIVDTGETSKSTSDPNYFPQWHPYYRTSLKTKIKPEEEIGPQLEKMGIKKDDISRVILTHLHTDHAGGLDYFKGQEILVSEKDYKLASGLSGRLLGYLPHRWPKDFNPFPITFNDEPFGPFNQSYRLTKNGDIFIVPTPGHTPNHLSVIVKEGDLLYFLAGDTSYSQKLLVEEKVDGVSPKTGTTIKTLKKIKQLARDFSLVYLPSHDSESEKRLRNKDLLFESKTNENIING